MEVLKVLTQHLLFILMSAESIASPQVHYSFIFLLSLQQPYQGLICSLPHAEDQFLAFPVILCVCLLVEVPSVQFILAQLSVPQK